MCYSRAGFTLRWAPGTLGIFATSSCQNNVDENQKKSYHLSVGPLALCHIVNRALVIALRS